MVFLYSAAFMTTFIYLPINTNWFLYHSILNYRSNTWRDQLYFYSENNPLEPSRDNILRQNNITICFLWIAFSSKSARHRTVSTHKQRLLIHLSLIWRSPFRRELFASSLMLTHGRAPPSGCFSAPQQRASTCCCSRRE